MLAEAHKSIARHSWPNVQLLHQDATRLQVDRDLDGVLFSLSYSALPEPRPALARAWERLSPKGRVVFMDMGLTHSRWHRLLDPIARLLVKLGPGDAYSDPWRDSLLTARSRPSASWRASTTSAQSPSPSSPKRAAQQKTPRRGGEAFLGLLQGGEICISIYVDPWEVGEPYMCRGGS